MRWFAPALLLALAASFQAPQQPPATAIIAGRVVDPSGAPIANAVVRLFTGQLPAPGRGLQGDWVATNAEGRFAFVGLVAVSYRLETSKPGWLPGAYGRRRPAGTSAFIPLAVGERRNDLTITMWKVGVLGGRVTADNGDPLIGAEVRAMRRGYVAGRPQFDTPIRARTDDRGVYRFSTLVPGDYLVVVLMSVMSEPPTFAGAIHAGGETPRAFLQTMTGIGTVPMLGLDERATGVMGAGQPLVASLSQSLAAPDAGQPLLAYETTFHPASSSMASAKVVHVVSGEPEEGADITVRLAQTWQVSGTLRDADGPLAWHAVHLVAAETGDLPVVDVATAVTDGAGAFTFYGVPRGQYIARSVRSPWPGGGGLAITGGTGAIPQVSMMAGPGAPSVEPLLHASSPVAVADRHVRGLALVMQPGPRVKGLLRFEGTTAEPADLSRSLVFLEPADGHVDRNPIPGAVTGDRRFTTASVVPGRYVLRVSPAPDRWWVKSVVYQGREIVDQSIDVTGDIDSVVITFTDRLRTITGTVNTNVAADLPGAAVVIFPADSASWVDYGRASLRVNSASVGFTGTFTLSLPPDGDYYLAALADEDSDDWRNPMTLKRLAAAAERIQVRGESIEGRSLQLRRLR